MFFFLKCDYRMCLLKTRLSGQRPMLFRKSLRTSIYNHSHAALDDKFVGMLPGILQPQYSRWIKCWDQFCIESQKQLSFRS